MHYIIHLTTYNIKHNGIADDNDLILSSFFASVALLCTLLARMPHGSAGLLVDLFQYCQISLSRNVAAVRRPYMKKKADGKRAAQRGHPRELQRRSCLILGHDPQTEFKATLQKGGVPATPSGTATLLRLSPSHRFRPRPLLAVTAFRRPRLPWLDGRCVQGPGTYSPRHG